MTVTYEPSYRTSSSIISSLPLEDRFEVIKEIGDGSFGSVVLARVRTAGAQVAKRNTLIAIKTMKKSFESFSPCLELREVIFLKTLPLHAHLVPALDIFLDPLSKKLHICMEYMDGNLYQLMKARDHKCLDGKAVKSILFQILSGLDHIHVHNFFHRDIKPENILVSTSASPESSALSRYSLVTPPATPPAYSIKIADFGLARETHSKPPYTSYVSTRWYRAPEVLLRAQEYSAPVDIWAIGAMAVEIATLKPLFPGSNEVDQVWRVCEIMGSPGNWYHKSGAKVGGGEWKDGTKLAQKLGFSFPKMAPHSMESILQAPQWPQALCNFVTWCLMWDPKNRPTSAEALNHEYFADAADPLRPKSSASRLLGRKQSDMSFKSAKETMDSPPLSTKPSWFRRSLIARESTPAMPQVDSARPLQVTQSSFQDPPPSHKNRSNQSKRATWNMAPSNGAPMPILPSIRPVSPLSNAVTAQANSRLANDSLNQHASMSNLQEEKNSKKIGRQLSVASNGNHYADIHRQEAERALNGNGGLMSPPGSQKESFFSHLRKRARRLSGRHIGQTSPHSEDIEANAGCGPWSSNRSSMALDPGLVNETNTNADFSELDKALRSVRYSLEMSAPGAVPKPSSSISAIHTTSKRHQAIPQVHQMKSIDNQTANPSPISSRTRRPLQLSNHPVHRYETPEEEDELLDEVLSSTKKVYSRLDQQPRIYENNRRSAHLKDMTQQALRDLDTNTTDPNPYPTPSPSSKRDRALFGHETTLRGSRPLNIAKPRSEADLVNSQWPTPPYEENEWAASAAASIFAAGSVYR